MNSTDDILTNALSQAGFGVNEPKAEETQTPVVEEQSQQAEPEVVNQTTDAPQEQTSNETPAEVEVVGDKEEVNEGGVYNIVGANDDNAASVEPTADVIAQLSETLGRDFGGVEDIVAAINHKETAELDPRVKAIADFVSETGRGPEDWFKYQSLTTEGMDDVTAVRNQLILENPELTNREIDLLMKAEYKLDADEYDEETVELNQIRLKRDARLAKENISKLRDSYTAKVEMTEAVAETTPVEDETVIDEQWVSGMTDRVNAMGTLAFQLPNGEKFNFGVTDEYKQQLINKNTDIENYFDPYVEEDGSWNFDKLNAHRTIQDNIGSIVKSVYQQGISDGQRKVVTDTARVDATAPQTGGANTGNDALADQLRAALGGAGGVKFNF